MSQNNRNDWKPKWQKDLDTYYSIYNTFIFTGYIDDMLPMDENGTITYVTMEEYIQKQYGGEDPKKCVIIYDPTESEDKQFKICAEALPVPPADEEEEEDGGDFEVSYADQRAQHFYDITKTDDMQDWLIEHKNSGPTLALSYIHYALTESGERISETEREHLPNRIRNLLNALLGRTNPGGYIFIIKMASRLLTRDTVSGNGNGISDDELIIFRQLLNIAQSIQSSDAGKIILLANKKEDLPVWFTDEISNHYLKVIDVEKPSEENRKYFFEHELIEGRALSDRFIATYNGGNEDYKEKIKKKYVAYTDDFTLGMHIKFGEYAKVVRESGSFAEFDDPEKIGFSVTTFRVGQMTNPWNDPDKVNALINIKDDIISKGELIGQNEALSQAQKILTSAAVGLGSTGSDAPRAVLFLAGPTGTGKTELCKKIAEKVFGSKDKMVRFDMSEYREAESDQKLFGAPPGYVGYENGGRLTNAIKKEPFSLVLFDEIEKAHPTILDKFLQIVGDGRLTDGKGETVRFTDCIIVVTSNAGITPDKSITAEQLSTQMGEEEKHFTEEFKEFRDTVDENGNRIYNWRVITIADIIRKEKDNVSKDVIYNNLKEQLRFYVKAYFYCKLGRPELYGRFSNAMVYYNFISADAVLPIVKKRVKEIDKDAITIKGLSEIDHNAVLDAIVKTCNCTKVRGSGARGIINAVNETYRDSLNDFFANQLKNDPTRSFSGCKLTCSLKADYDPSRQLTSDDLVWSI